MLTVLAEYPFELLGLGVLLFGSAFFSGSETALFNLTRDQLRRFRESRSPLRNLAAHLMEDPRRLLVTVLFGNMTVNVAFFALSVLLTIDIARDHPAYAGPFRIGMSVVTPLVVIVFGEVTPKSIAATIPERLAPVAAGPLALLEYVVLPVRLLLGTLFIRPLERLIVGGRSEEPALVTTDELQEIVEVAAREGAVSTDESEILAEIIELTELQVREVMRPRVEIVACDVATPMPEVLELFRESNHSRIVVYDDEVDNVLGVVYGKTAFLEPEGPLERLVRPVGYVPETKTIESLLRQFRREKSQFALVVDEYGGLAGLVTLDDCLEEIVGAFEDENGGPPPEPFVRLSPSEYLVSGDLSVRSWAELFDLDRPSGGGRYSTLAGFVTSLLGRVPHKGDRAGWRNLEFIVEEVKRRRITLVRLRLQDTEPAEPDAPAEEAD